MDFSYHSGTAIRGAGFFFLHMTVDELFKSAPGGMISKEEINLWLMSNRLCVMPIASYKTYCTKLVEAEERLLDLEPKLRRLEAMRLGDLAEQNKHLKKKRASLKRKLERLKTNRVKRLLSLLAKARSRNRKAQPQTP